MEGLKLAYRGFPGRLNPEQKQEIITWLQQRNYWNIEALADFIYEHYQVEFSSRQSYSALCNKAGITWKKAQGVNPKKDEEQIASKKRNYGEA
ncbi:helix-turn-helix domain-containing protein [Anthocerotibacter panamensis]|uniref:helix-turn-helix domain-containing protein n=1 Tax=Anthocerotibacter panamensis TaxID=2857077 RepID=UPI001C4072D5|nr:winged helix-turn-helix domain-containing protein [Anthocerotibacter panamensis]